MVRNEKITETQTKTKNKIQKTEKIREAVMDLEVNKNKN